MNIYDPKDWPPRKHLKEPKKPDIKKLLEKEKRKEDKDELRKL